MSLTQIPLEPPPPKNVPEQGDLFDAATWETAYREMHDFPTLLIQARDELARSRKREAFWMSLVAHFILLLIILNFPKLERYFPQRTVMLAETGPDMKNPTFLELPPDAEKPQPPKKSNIISDKNRTAQSRTPQPDREQLKKLLDAMRRGRPGPTAPPQPQQRPTPPAQAQAAQAQPPQQKPEQQAQTAPAPALTAKLQSPPVARKPNFDTGPMSASRAIDEAARQAALNHSRSVGDEGDLGLGQRQNTARAGIDVLSDTMGVDFGPYLQRVLHDVRQNWYNIIPESAMPPLLKKGKVSIEFAILKNGQIAGMKYVTSSGDVALDRAAYGGITASNPFPPLPREFAGQYLGLRFTFFYNPDPKDADLQ